MNLKKMCKYYHFGTTIYSICFQKNVMLFPAQPSKTSNHLVDTCYLSSFVSIRKYVIRKQFNLSIGSSC